MHKGRAYELEPRYRVFAANNFYPTAWPAASLTVEAVTWAGTAAALAPAAPFLLLPTGVTADLHARYEAVLWDNGGGDHAILAFEWIIFNSWQLKRRLLGDWGINGSLPDVANYYFSQSWHGFDTNIISAGTPAEAFLRPSYMRWNATPY